MAKRNSCCISAVHHPCAGDETQMSLCHFIFCQNPYQNRTSLDHNLRCSCSPQENLMIRSVPVPFDFYHLISACVVKSDAVGGELGASGQFVASVAHLDRQVEPQSGHRPPLLSFQKDALSIMQLNISPPLQTINVVVSIQLIIVCSCEVCMRACVQ